MLKYNWTKNARKRLFGKAYNKVVASDKFITILLFVQYYNNYL